MAHIRDETVERLVNFSQDHNLRRRGSLTTLRNGPKADGIFRLQKKVTWGKLKRGTFQFQFKDVERCFFGGNLGDLKPAIETL